MSPIKVIKDSRLAYITSLETVYKNLGYGTKVNGFIGVLEVYQKGVIVPQTHEEQVIEHWIG